MDVMLAKKSDLLIANELGKLLDDHRGGDVVVMDMRELNFWTDFFIIATVTSSTHLSGLERHIKDFVRENDLDIFNRSRRPKNKAEPRESAGEWSLLDIWTPTGGIVVHLMTESTRSFFELERLWSAAPVIFKASSHSSKSS